MSDEARTDRQSGGPVERLARLAQSIGESRATTSALRAVARAAADLFGFSRVWIWRVDHRHGRLLTLAAMDGGERTEEILLQSGLLRTVCEDRVPRLRVDVSEEKLGAKLDLPGTAGMAGALLPLLSGGELEGLLLGVWEGGGPGCLSSLPALLTLAAEAGLLVRLDRLVREQEQLGAQYAALADQLHAGVAVITRQHDFLYTNARFWQLLGLPPEHVQRLSVEELIPDPTGQAQVREFLHQAWAQPRESTLRGLSLRRATGPAATVTLSAQRLPLGASVALQLVVAQAADQPREELAAGDPLRAFGLYLAGLANDLKGPLTAYLGHLKLLGDRKDLPTDLREAFHLYREVTAEVLARISRTMEWGRRFPVKEPVDLRAVVQDAVATIEGGDLPDTVQLIVEAEPVWPVNGMADQLQVAIEALLRNACEALVDRGGTIRVSCTMRGDTVSVAVSDSGEGIPESILPYIFDPFSSTKGAGEGRGLGLAIVKEIAARHGGRVEARSEPGRGTTVSLAFPRLAQAKADAGSPANRQTVLLVDDDAGIRESYRLMLEAARYRVATAMDADDALRQIAVEAPDILLIDVQMPGRDGVALVEALRKWHPEYLGRTVLHTAYAHEARVRDTARRCGVMLLEKPCDPEILFKTLARLGRRDHA